MVHVVMTFLKFQFLILVTTLLDEGCHDDGLSGMYAVS